MNICFFIYVSDGLFPTVFAVLIRHDARIAPSSDSKNIAEISFSDMYIYSLEILINYEHILITSFTLLLSD